MNKEKLIEVSITEQELQEMLHEDKEFNWTFDNVELHIFKGEE